VESLWGIDDGVGGDELAAYLAEHPAQVSGAVKHLSQQCVHRLDLLERVLSLRPDRSSLDFGLSMAARKRGSAPFVRALLGAGASPVTASGGSAVWHAAAAGDAVTLRLLLDAGGDHAQGRPFMGRDDDEPFPLVAAVRSGDVDAVAVLLDAGADPNVVTGGLRRPLDIAEDLGQAAAVRLLIERGGRRMQPDDLDLNGAARVGHRARVEELLPAATPQMRGGALVHAVQKAHADIAEVILRAGDIDPYLLVQALCQCIANCPERVSLFVGSGVDFESANNFYHKAPLLIAAERGRVAAVRALLAVGVDVGVVDQDGGNALELARKAGHDDVVAVLARAGLDAPTPAEQRAAMLESLAGHRRDTWIPVRGDRALVDVPEDLSWFGGLPLLAGGETWPLCAGCPAALTFFAQVDLAVVPDAGQGVGADRLLQFFYCLKCEPSHAFDDGALVRLVDPAGRTVAAESPEGVAVFPPRPVLDWIPLDDYPYREGPLSPAEATLAFELNQQGDKVGGWPNWVQDPDYPQCPQGDHQMRRLALQIDSHSGVPHMWGDNGVGLILQCHEHPRQLAFCWQSA
jgi:ankyrin repeat protein